MFFKELNKEHYINYKRLKFEREKAGQDSLELAKDFYYGRNEIPKNWIEAKRYFIHHGINNQNKWEAYIYLQAITSQEKNNNIFNDEQFDLFRKKLQHIYRYQCDESRWGLENVTIDFNEAISNWPTMLIQLEKEFSKYSTYESELRKRFTDQIKNNLSSQLRENSLSDVTLNFYTI